MEKTRELLSSKVYGVYEEEFVFMPWKNLIDRILDLIEKKLPENSNVLDLMCGPGYLLGQICQRRGDLRVKGLDIQEEFIEYAQKKYPAASFQVADVLSWQTNEKYDLVVCTAGIHHLAYERQEFLVKKVSQLLKLDSFCIFADPYVDDFSNEKERKRAVAKLGYEYLLATIENDAPDEVIEATVGILRNDMTGFERKTSLKKIKPVFEKIFSSIEVNKTWPETESEYGDYYIIGYP